MQLRRNFIYAGDVVPREALAAGFQRWVRREQHYLLRIRHYATQSDD